MRLLREIPIRERGMEVPWFDWVPPHLIEKRRQGLPRESTVYRNAIPPTQRAFGVGDNL